MARVFNFNGRCARAFQKKLKGREKNHHQQDYDDDSCPARRTCIARRWRGISAIRNAEIVRLQAQHDIRSSVQQ
jgi:hypothetical protein